MAEVFRATFHGVAGFERELAIKRILPHVAKDRQYIDMFVDEAKIAARLTHPNIVKILDLGHSHGEYFIAMEYLRGVDLRTVLSRCAEVNQAVPLRLACFILSRVCDALSYAHNKCDLQGRPLNIVHRDATPENILISSNGEVKLIDFGLARAAQRLAHTQTGFLKGKVAYFAPELIDGRPTDHRVDIFVAGVVLWEMLANARLFTRDTDWETVDAIRDAGYPAPSSHNSRVPAALDRMVGKALQLDPEARYQDAGDLRKRLQAFSVTHTGRLGTTRELAAWVERIMADDFLENEPTRMLAWAPCDRERALLPRVANVIESLESENEDEDEDAHEDIVVAKPEAAEPAPRERPSKITVAFESEPAGATVYVITKGVRRKLGTTPVDAVLDAHTKYDASIRKPGYSTWTRPLDFGDEPNITIRARLREK